MPGVYVSYPFCPQKCTFCNFASGVFPGLESNYIDALVKEIRQHEWTWIPDSVYLGGGTPSTLEPGSLARILTPIPGRPWREAAIEAMPGTLDRDRVAAWRRLGINRVSLGVQSFIDTEIRHTGRKHDAAQVAADCALLRGAGIENINLDLIAGLPGQTPASWNRSLDYLERLDPPHVSVYLLEVDEDSRLGLEVLNNGARFGARQVPDDDAMAGLYEIAVDRLAGIGLQRYEVSNFAHIGYESHHNLKYWQLAPYAGFGADAHSFNGTERSANVETAQAYIRSMETAGSARLHTTAAAGDERFFIGLRLIAGIEPSPEEWRRYSEPIDRFIGQGLLERRGNRLRLTSQGVLLSNEVFQEFLA